MGITILLPMCIIGTVLVFLALKNAVKELFLLKKMKIKRQIRQMKKMKKN